MVVTREPGLPPRPPLLHRATPAQLLLFDRVIAALLMLVAALRALHLATDLGAGSLAIANVVTWFAVAVALAVRRLSPRSSLVLASAVAVIGITGRIGSPGVWVLILALTVYQVAATTARGSSFATLVAMLLVFAVAAAAAGNHGRGPASAAGLVAVASWFVGDSVRVRRVYVAGLAEQAAQRQREALERAQRSLAEQRLQIARELHDVVAHSLSVIAVQSGVGRHVIDTNPVEAKRALSAVEETSRAALDELRRMLGVLRGSDVGPVERSPAPGISGLGRLAEQVRSTGIPVELAVRSRIAGELSPAAELSVFRIVQEALTNVVKHAGHASASVELRDEGDELVVEVLDDGLGGAGPIPYPGPGVQPSAGHGLVGMRERVSLFEGRFAAGPRAEGGFQVTARFPAERVSAA